MLRLALAPKHQKKNKLPAPIVPIDDADLDNEVVLPEQFFPANGTNKPEHKLLGAMVLDAVQAVVGNKAVSREEWLADIDWLKSTADGDGTFVWCCSHLGLNSGMIRKAALARQRRRTK